MAAASSRFCLCLILILISFSLSENRPLSAPPPPLPHIQGRNLTGLIRALGEDAQQVLNTGVENEKKNKGLYESKRASPGAHTGDGTTSVLHQLCTLWLCLRIGFSGTLFE
ncbi:hypothetical protein EZV62_026829 [Acer yangbiense]|uniref:Uncharacterized protein n=1 Tax=Acer yangbiense TaxID=1000413 RepID=A0A5C7GSI3_9ROSI|nr:hypothetical protein EZV62_026829 [Acer yangbiense]